MNYPSIKTLRDRLGIHRREALELRDAMKKGKALHLANIILGGFGVETICLPDGCCENCRTPDVYVRYVNMGDTYKTTLLKVNGAYRVGNWGDVVERYQA